MRKRVELVFQWTNDFKEEVIELPTSFTWATVNYDDILQYFPEEPLKTIFLKFLQQKFYGVYIFQNSNWAAYGWMSRPSTPGPIHLSPEIQQLKLFWIFFCYTKESFRGRGLYKVVLNLLIQQALDERKDAEIYIDTQIDNIPARKAISSVGFESKGIVHTYKVGIPKIKIWTWGKWNQEAVHPTLLK